MWNIQFRAEVRVERILLSQRLHCPHILNRLDSDLSGIREFWGTFHVVSGEATSTKILAEADDWKDGYDEESHLPTVVEGESDSGAHGDDGGDDGGETEVNGLETDGWAHISPTLDAIKMLSTNKL